MKSRLIAFLSITTLILAGFTVWQQRELREMKLRLSKMAADLQTESDARKEQEHRATALKRRESALSQQVMELSGLAANLRSSESKYASNYARLAKPNPTESDSDAGLFGGKGMGAFLSKMMKHPAMKEMMRTTQRTALTSMYGPLLKDLNLPSDQKQKFMDLLVDHQLKSAEQAETFLDKDGKMDFSKIGDVAKTEETRLEEELKPLLGEAKFAQYQDYKKNIGERMQVDQFRQQLDGTDSALKEDQLKKLMSVMAEEREKNPPALSTNPQEGNFEKFMDPNSFEKQMQWQEEMNRRVLERAGEVLTPEQLKSYAEFQAQQLQMQKLGMKMAQQMFGTCTGRKPHRARNRQRKIQQPLIEQRNSNLQ